MKPRWALWLGGSIVVLSVGLSAATVYLLATSAWAEAVTLPHAIVNSVIGLLIVRRKPDQRIGWVFLSAGALFGILGFSLAYTSRSYITGPRLPFAVWIAWLSDWSWVLPVSLLVFVVPILFPTGRLPSRRWAVVVVAGFISTLVTAVGGALTPLNPAPGIPSGSIPHPFIRDAGILEVAERFEVVGPLTFVLCVLAAAVSVVVRYRRGGDHERRQLRWLLYAVALTAFGLFVMTPFWETTAGNLIGPTVFLFIPVGAGIAIMKHRLYDIDVVINKTIVYVALTTVLVAVYAGAVVVLQSLLRPLTSGSDFAVAGSTLAAAALFSPVRKRIQNLVDRRFYRSRYDARRELDAFVGRLREQVDTRMLTSDLLGVVGSTLQPSRAYVWLSDGPR